MRLREGNILFINPFGIGDVLFSTPLVRTVRRAFPSALIGFVCNRRTAEVLATNPDIDRVFIVEKDDLRALRARSVVSYLGRIAQIMNAVRRERFTLAFDLSLGHEYSLFSALIGIRRRIGFDYRGRGRFLTTALPLRAFEGKHVAEFHLDLARALGITPSEAEGLVLKTDAENRSFAQEFFAKHGLNAQSVVCVFPGGGASYGAEKKDMKRWPPERFARAADLAAEQTGVSVMIAGSHDEADLIQRTAEFMTHRPLIVPPTTVRNIAALIRRCALVLCNDGGPLHLAVSQNTPTVSVFGPTDPVVYGPYPAHPRHRVFAAGIPCAPCYRSFKLPDCATRACLSAMTADEVGVAVAEAVRRFTEPAH